MKKVLIVAGALIGLLLMAGIAVVLLFDLNAYKPRIEREVSDALGMEFRIQGKAGLRILPPAGVSLEDIRLRNRGTELAKVGSVRVGVALRPLLKKQLVVTELILVDPMIRIEKGADGKFNFESPRPGKPPEPKGKAGVPLSVANAEVRNGGFVYLDRSEGGKTEVVGMDLVLKEFSLPADPDIPLVKGVRFQGELGVKEVKTTAATLRDVKGTVVASGGVYDIRPLSLKVFGGTGEGSIRVDLSKQEPLLRLDYRLSGIRAEETLAGGSKESPLSGTLNLSLDLSVRGTGATRMKRTLNGKAVLRSEGLTIHGMDLDEVLSSVTAVQNLNLADVGSFLLASPIRTTAKKGLRFAGIGKPKEGKKETAVTKLVSDWTVRNGIAERRDVAFSTRKNRIAMNGKLDLVKERFVNVTVAVLTPKGCAKIRQDIEGPFQHPEVDKLSTLESTVVDTVVSFFEPAKKIVEETCKPFYTGSVPHPR